MCSTPQGDRVCVGELQYQCQEYHTLLQAANVERDRLSELVEVTQRRLVSQHRLNSVVLLAAQCLGGSVSSVQFRMLPVQLSEKPISAPPVSQKFPPMLPLK